MESNNPVVHKLEVNPASDIDICMVSYKTPEIAQQCLDKIRETTASYDRLPIVGQVVHLDNSEKNENLHTLWNRFLHDSTATYVCFLTADTVPEGEWLRDLYVTAIRGDFAAVGPSTNSCYNEQSGRAAEYCKLAYVDGVPCFVPQVVLTGLCMLLNRKSALAIGGFREDFDFYGGDLDFMLRLMAAQYVTAWCVPAYVGHLNGSSSKAMGEEWYKEKRDLGGKQLTEAMKLYGSLCTDNRARRFVWTGSKIKVELVLGDTHV